MSGGNEKNVMDNKILLLFMTLKFTDNNDVQSNIVKSLQLDEKDPFTSSVISCYTQNRGGQTNHLQLW